MAVIDNKTKKNVPESSTTQNDRRKPLILWLLFPLLIILGIAGYLLSNGNDAGTSSTPTKSVPRSSLSKDAKSETKSINNSYISQFNAAVPPEQRVIYFVADKANLQDITAANAVIAKIAAFYKSNPQANLVVNGSIVNGQPDDQAEPLAKQRAELVTQQLIGNGVKASSIQTAETNTYQGNTNAAQAEYARSVTIAAK